MLGEALIKYITIYNLSKMKTVYGKHVVILILSTALLV